MPSPAPASKGRTYPDARAAVTTKQLDGYCPTLAADVKHRRWFSEVYVPTLSGGRKQLRQGTWASKREAEAELRSVLNRRDATPPRTTA